MALEPQRRSFLGFLTFGLGAIFSAILGVPIVCYVIDPRHRRAPKSAMKLIDGVKLDDLRATPVQGVIRDTRVDGWTLYPNDVLGRVWVVKRDQALPAFPDKAAVVAFNARPQAEKDAFLLVFTTICPHLGCSVNLGGDGFLCPCHSARFTLAGAQAGVGNPARRGMDSLEWEIDEDDPEFNRLEVKYQRFEALKIEKNAIG